MWVRVSMFFFFFNDTATTEIYTLSLHDALPISSLAPHERLTDLAVAPREKPHPGAATREQPRDSRVIQRRWPTSPAWPSDQSRDLSPNASGGLTPLSPPSELQEIPVAIREQSGVLCFHSR